MLSDIISRDRVNHDWNQPTNVFGCYITSNCRYIQDIRSVNFSSKNTTDEDNGDEALMTLLSTKYKILSGDNAPLILDSEAERQKADEEAANVETQETALEEEDDLISHFDLTRGVRGVFDIEHLVDVLHSEGAIDLFVCQVPDELCYADQIVIVTGRSVRHRISLAQLVRRVFKKKRNSSDILPRVEGTTNGGQADWLAMDLGNIILHIFARATREKYDLESLWSLGSKHDTQSNKKDDELLELLSNKDLYLEDLEPADPAGVGSKTAAKKIPSVGRFRLNSVLFFPLNWNNGKPYNHLCFAMSEVEAAAAAADNAISEVERLEKEAMLTEKMAKMREKNEAIRKRYNEVQEDLKNAQTISSQVKVESGSDDEDRKPVVRKVTNKTPSRDRECKQKFTPRRQNSESSSSQDTGAEQSMQARPVHSFGEGGGPPPDPGYNFLADEERDGPKENKEQKEKGVNKNNPASSGHGGGFKQNQQQPQRGRFPRQRGGQRGNRQFQGENFSRSAMEGGPHDKDQKWREERAAIDEARIRRQQSADGNWRREWDNNKDDTQPQTPHNQIRGGRGRGGDRGSFGGGQQRGGNGTKFFYQQRGLITSMLSNYLCLIQPCSQRRPPCRVAQYSRRRQMGARHAAPKSWKPPRLVGCTY
ncbi:Hypothetical predicted protein [Cloeon dipterum]|uniref:Mitochondrial assembly of ribosomal large subunit protein 1 n=1 Tax=Cloeon dipterum TaxID=197152 RepID=A0A8S1CTU2_9INSE|nr:Hypothetical predicted protein [Cloeon dipterum]